MAGWLLKIFHFTVGKTLLKWPRKNIAINLNGKICKNYFQYYQRKTVKRQRKEKEQKKKMK